MATKRPQRAGPRETVPLPAVNGVPEGWVIAPLPDVAQINPPKPAGTALPADTPVTFVPMAAVDERNGTIANPTTRPFSEVRKGYTAFSNDDVIMAKITPCMENGKTAIARDLVSGLGFGSTEFHVFRSHGAVLPEYLYHYLRQESFRRAAEDEMTGSVGQKRVPRAFLELVHLPIPPRAEQRRIVNLLEQLLGKLDSCRDRLERVPAILARFRQAVLAAACSGRLTEEWRGPAGRPRDTDGRDSARTYEVDTSDLPQLPGGWRWEHLGTFIRSIEAGRSFACTERPPHSTEVGVLKVSAVTWGRFNEDESKTCTDPSKISPRFFVKPGDFLFSRANTIELVGTCVIAETVTRRTMLSDKTLRLVFRDIEPHWVLWMLRSPHGRAEIERLATGNQQSMRNIGQARIRAIRLPVPPRAEQRELTRRIRVLHKLSSSVEARISRQQARGELLSQSLLTRAFRGELVPTEAELAAKEGRPYESGQELLSKIAVDGSAASGRSTPRRPSPDSRRRRQ